MIDKEFVLAAHMPQPSWEVDVGAEEPVDFVTRPWPVVRTAIVNGLRLHRPLTMYALAELDVSAVVAHFAEVRRHHRVALSITAHLVWALAQTLDRHPTLNSFRRGRSILTFRDVDVVVPFDRRLPDGTRYAGAGTLRAAQTLSPGAVAAELRRLIKQAPTDSPEVRRRRRFARLPSLLQRLIFWRIARDPLALRRIYGTTALSAYTGGRPMAIATQTLAPNPFTVSILAGGVVRARTVEGEVVHRVPITTAVDHAIADGAEMVSAFKTLSDFAATASVWTDAEVGIAMASPVLHGKPTP